MSKTSRRKLHAIDLFCGIGGTTLGLRRAGFNVLAGVENNADASRIYSLNHPQVEIFGDITTINTLSMKRKLGLRKGDLDLLIGCPPCQGFSSLTTMNGHWEVEDERNDLVLSFCRFIKDFAPRSIMLENVPGMVNDARFLAFLDLLKQMKYETAWSIVNAESYGVPQRRKRLILIASKHGNIAPPMPKKRSRKTVFQAIGKLAKAGSSGDMIHDLPEKRSEKVKRLISAIPKDGGSRCDLPARHQLECHKRTSGFNDVYGRMAWDDVAPTITTGCFNPSKGRFLHPEANRCITMREAALLQGFPVSYALPADVGKTALATMIGNAFPPEVVRTCSIAIKRHLESN